MRKYYYLNYSLLLLLALSLILGVGHATAGGVIFALLLWGAPAICAVLLVILLIRYKIKDAYAAMALTAFTGSAPWLALGMLIQLFSQ